MTAATLTGNLFERLKAWRRSRAVGGSNGSNSGSSSTSALPVRDHIDIPGARAVRLLAFDQALVAVIGVLLAFGLVMVFSTTIAMSEVVQIKRVLADGTVIKENVGQTYWVKRHVQALAIAFIAALITLRVPTTVWEKYAPLIFIAALVLLVVVLIPGIGIVANKSRRWLPLGLMQFQPGELAKLAIAMYSANYMLRRMDKREQFFKAVMPMVLAVAVAGGLLLRQPDMGTFIVIATIAMGVLFLGGVNARMFFLIAAVIVATFALLIAFDDLRRERIFAFLDPWNPKYVQGKAYQLTHSLIALGRGEWFGNGLGSSVEKLHYLPEAHTDFMLAVIGEELGFAGVASVIVLFFWLVRRIFVIGRQAVALDRVYAGLMVQGVGIWMGAQGFINMGVNLGVLPTKGLTLPLMSYGGSAILVTLVALAMVVRVDVENRALMRGGRS